MVFEKYKLVQKRRKILKKWIILQIFERVKASLRKNYSAKER